MFYVCSSRKAAPIRKRRAYSITSSARARTEVGIAPSDPAVLRLTMSSYLAGAFKKGSTMGPRRGDPDVRSGPELPRREVLAKVQMLAARSTSSSNKISDFANICSIASVASATERAEVSIVNSLLVGG